MKKYLFLLAPLLSLQALYIQGAGDLGKASATNDMDLVTAPANIPTKLVGDFDIMILDDLYENGIERAQRIFNSDPIKSKFTTLLHLAAQHNHKGAVERLLQAGYDVNQVDIWGRPALAYVYSPQIARVLLEAGADPSIKFIVLDKGTLVKTPADQFMATASPEMTQPLINAVGSDNLQDLFNANDIIPVISKGAPILGTVIDFINSTNKYMTQIRPSTLGEKNIIDHYLNQLDETKRVIQNYKPNKAFSQIPV